MPKVQSKNIRPVHGVRRTHPADKHAARRERRAPEGNACFRQGERQRSSGQGKEEMRVSGECARGQEARAEPERSVRREQASGKCPRQRHRREQHDLRAQVPHYQQSHNYGVAGNGERHRWPPPVHVAHVRHRRGGAHHHQPVQQPEPRRPKRGHDEVVGDLQQMRIGKVRRAFSRPGERFHHRNVAVTNDPLADREVLRQVGIAQREHGTHSKEHERDRAEVQPPVRTIRRPP